MEPCEAFRLYPDKSSTASCMVILANNRPLARTFDRFNREQTAEPEDEATDADDALPSLSVPFGPFTMGRDPDCNLVLDNNSISGQHCTFHFDEKGSLMLRDKSRNGTKIWRGDKELTCHRDTWTIRKHDDVDSATAISVWLGPFKFDIRLPKATEAYIHKAKQSSKAPSELPDIFAFLKTYSIPNTCPPSGAATPRRDVWIQRLGQGEFGIVELFRNAESGKQYVQKTPKCGFASLLQEEAKLMQDLEHDNIVKLLEYVSSSPKILLEYAPLGPLSGHSGFSEEECISITKQLTGAGAYLHGKGIFHRDIKPDNILIFARSPDEIKVKLSDFGLSKTIRDSKLTICGTLKYLALEIWDGGGYGAAVDVWSLGVVLLEIHSGLPRSRSKDTQESWCKKVADKASEEINGTDSLSALLGFMLVIQPEKRLASHECHEKSLKLCTGSWRSASRESQEVEESEEDQTVVLPQNRFRGTLVGRSAVSKQRAAPKMQLRWYGLPLPKTNGQQKCRHNRLQSRQIR